MNKKISSVGTSLILHLVFLALALNTVIYTFVAPPSGNMPLFVHVNVDSKLLSMAKPYEGKKISQNAPVQLARESVSAPPNDLKPQSIPMEHKVTPTPLVPPAAVDKAFVSIIKEMAPEQVSEALNPKRVSSSVLVTNEDAAKDLNISSSNIVNQPIAPVLSAYKASAIESPGVPGQFSPATALRDSKENTPNLSFEPATSAGDIKDFLGYDLRTYEDPSDHNQYFKLSIRVGDVPGALSAIPKEIVFLVDSSTSIGPKTLKEFKRGVEDCFNLLGREDKFNLIVFKHNAVSISKDLALANIPANIKMAKYFLDDTMANNDTDVYEAVLKSINLKDPMKPSYVLLISDGQPTAGVTNPQQIINQIARINQGRVPLFAFGAGMFLDKYLMSFLSFTNRGWAEFEPNDIARGIVDMYNHIKDPVLLDLRYYVSGLNEKEIYPKLLPDFFKGSQFVLYGRYNKEQLFYFQLFGDAKDGVKQYLISDDISQAPRGDKRIAQEWAIRKVYDLIGRLEYNKNNQDLIKEIKHLQKKFHLNLTSFLLEQINHKGTPLKSASHK